jgi:hypothetical protein
VSFVLGMRFELGDGTFGPGAPWEALEMLLPVEGKELQRFGS